MWSDCGSPIRSRLLTFCFFFVESDAALRTQLESYKFSELSAEVERLKKRDEERQAELDGLAKAKEKAEKAAVDARQNFEQVEQGYNKQRKDDQEEITKLKDELAA